MRIAINAWSLMSPHTGIATYTRNLITALREPGNVETLLFYGFSWSRELRESPIPGMGAMKSLVKRLLPDPYKLSRVLQQIRFTQGATRLKPELYHEPAFLPYRFDGPTVITIHDLSPLRYPETHPADRVRNFRQHLPDAIDRAARIIVDSEFVGREVIEMFGADSARVRPIHLGVSPVYRPRFAEETAACMARYGLERGQYIFAVGTLEPRKNLMQSIDAHARLPERARKGAPLVVAGAKGWVTTELEAKLGAAERRGEVRWLGYVPESDLPMLYSAARFLVYPSLYEGFGLPVLEAMASGIPVITSNQASLPEVAGQAAIMVDPRDGDELRNAMLRLIEDQDEVRRLVDLGRAQAARFTWRACAERTLIVYREALQAASRK